MAGSLELLLLAMLLLPLYFFTGFSGTGGDSGIPFAFGGYHRWLAMVSANHGDYGPVLGVLAIGAAAFLSDLVWCLLMAACGIWAAVSRRSHVVVWLKGLALAAVLLLTCFVVDRIGMDLSRSWASHKWMGVWDGDYAADLTRDYFTEPARAQNPVWMTALQLAGSLGLRSLLALFLLLRAARKFDIIALDSEGLLARLRPKVRRRVYAVLIGTPATALVACGLWLWHIDSEHQKLLERARARLSELNCVPPPDEENAAEKYREAFALLTLLPTQMAWTYTTPLEEFTMDIGDPKIGALLEQESTVLGALKDAADRPQCVFVSDYSAGVHTELPSLMDARVAALLLSIAAKRAAHDGDYREAADCVRKIFRLAEGIGRIRILLAHSTGISLEHIGIMTTRDLLLESNLGELALQLLLEVMEEHRRAIPPYCDALLGDYLVGMCLVAGFSASSIGDDNMTGGERSLSSKIAFSLRRSTGQVLSDAKTCDLLFAQAYEAADGPVGPAYMRTLILWRRPDVTDRLRTLGDPYDSILYHYPSLEPTLYAETILRCASLAVACRLHQAKTGKLPETLADLASYFPKDFTEVPQDPLSGKELSYRRTETGFIIYSGNAGREEAVAKTNPYDDYLKDYPEAAVFPVDRQLWEAHRAEQLKINAARAARRQSQPQLSPSRRGDSPPADPSDP
jgi:hypothetical protein